MVRWRDAKKSMTDLVVLEICSRWRDVLAGAEGHVTASKSFVVESRACILPLDGLRPPDSLRAPGKFHHSVGSTEPPKTRGNVQRFLFLASLIRGVIGIELFVEGFCCHFAEQEKADRIAQSSPERI
jgi:hypothetical protein